MLALSAAGRAGSSPFIPVKSPYDPKFSQLGFFR